MTVERARRWALAGQVGDLAPEMLGVGDTGGARAWDSGIDNPWSESVADRLHFDPLRGMVNPAAGRWFLQQALELAQKANLPLLRR